MPRIVAACWDDERWTAAVAQVRGSRFTIERWLTGTGVQGAGLGAALDAAKLATEPCWVAIGRGRVELRPIRIPPMPSGEWPSIARMQALQQASSDRLLCDFLPLREDERGAELLLASAGGEVADAASKSIAPANLQRLALRPLCSAAWFSHAWAHDEAPTMLIDIRRGEADVVAFRERLPVFIRTVRLPDDPAGASELVAMEAKRSLITSGIGESLGNQPPRITLWGNAKTGEQFLPALQRSFSTTIRVLSPLAVHADVPAPPAEVGLSDVAAVLGLLHAGAAAPERIVDFVQPRKTPEPPSRTRRYALIGGTVAAIVIGGGNFAWQRISKLQQKAAELQQDSTAMNADVDIAKTQRANMALVEKFTNSNVQWLEEMAKFAEVAPPANQLMVTAINAQAALPGPGTASNLRGGTLTVTGVTVDQDLLGGIETKLGAAGITVERGKVTQESTRAPYVWAFNQKLQVPPISKQQLIAKKPVESTDEVSEPAAESTAKPASVATPAAPKDQAPAQESPQASPAPAAQAAPAVQPAPATVAPVEQPRKDQPADQAPSTQTPSTVTPPTASQPEAAQ